LAAGNYLLIATNTSGLIAGTVPAVTVNAGGLAAGTSASLALNGGQLYLVDQNITTTSLATSGSPSPYGQPVTLTATVSPAPATVGETITFYEGATAIGTGTNNAGGVARLTTSVLAAGTHSLTAVYPGDASNLGSTTTTLLQAVNSTPLAITANGSNKVYDGLAFSGGNGVTYAGFVNGQTNTVLSGPLIYTGSSQGAIAAGAYTITPGGLTNASGTNYAINFVSGTLTINQASPSISWTNPAAIIYGTPLSSLQLNASANVDGAFAYHPTNGAVLNVGTNTLTAMFTPSNSVDYLSVTSNVSLVVLPPGLPGTGTNITVSVAGNLLNLSWPTNYIGWLLQSNPLSLASTGSWFLVPGSAGTNLVQITIDPTKPNVFYRMAPP